MIESPRHAVSVIRKTLMNERYWREKVFSGPKREAKVTEINEALVALSYLEGLVIDQTVDENQLSLFPERNP